MPMIDSFAVVEVVKGNLMAKCIQVRAFTERGRSYPKELIEGHVYTLRLTPKGPTKQQLRANEQDDGSFVVVDGDEIEEEKAGIVH